MMMKAMRCYNLRKAFTSISLLLWILLVILKQHHGIPAQIAAHGMALNVMSRQIK
jgi:hypothetical protein